jgi:hypothetical protein
MKKIVLIALVLFMSLAFAFSAFQLQTGNAAALTAKVCPMVGWNTRGCTLSNGADSVSFFIIPLPLPTMDVGWNT